MLLRRAVLLTPAVSGIAAAALPSNYQAAEDWLLNPRPFSASVVHDAETGTLVLDNGLVRRVIDTRLGTTTGYVNRMTGASVIRAVEPEATLTINGAVYQAGAVTGQVNKAFLTDPEIAAMQPAPGSLRYVGHEIGEPVERFAWKRVRHHAPDVVWPPKGKTLRIDYRFVTPAGSSAASDHRRELLFSDDFATLRKDWKIRTSPTHERSSFANEGKPGEIHTPPHTAVVAERPLPPGTALAEARIHPGTDTSTSWGPGIALVFRNGRAVKLNIRPGGLAGVNHPVLGVFDGHRELPDVSGGETIDTNVAWTLRARIDRGRLSFDARPADGAWRTWHTQDIPGDFGEPVAFRVGKMDLKGGTGDHEAGGDLVRLKVEQVRFFGPERETADAASGDELRFSIHYQIYDGIPLISKWFTLTNHGAEAVNLDSFVSEQLAVVEHDNVVDDRGDLRPPDGLHVETDMAFGSFNHSGSSRHTVHWETDPDFHTQVTYSKSQPCLLKVRPAVGPDQTIAPGSSFTSFRTFELAQDSGDRERRGLALRRMYRTLAPWVTENPLMFHLLTSDEEKVKQGIDQAAEVGFEMVILSFGSGFNAENEDPAHLAKWKRINDHALAKGIDLGAYSLYSSRRVGGGNDIVSPTGGTTHGNCPAITSEWGRNYIRKLRRLFETTGFMVFENDGPYPGDIDTTARPPWQKGAKDSQWVHWRTWTDFYQKLRGMGVYMNLPDYYFLSGSNKCGMGYREVNWSLPRAEQRVITRQNIYDGTWEKIPSMGWMFVPLAQYHGGGAAATIEPLDEHRDHYRAMMLSNLGLGVQACYRGPRLYDTDATRQMVESCVDWFKQHRDILESDVIHGRRADGRDLDWMLHVNPALENKALLAVFNPTERTIPREIAVPLYYSGLSGEVRCSMNGGEMKTLRCDGDRRLRIPVEVPPQGFTWVLFR
ncbi:MAG: hypothetical protein H7A48_04950 [Akkermansiaceae bacterium]|nr:hypothetical protein [Akkermansiaceae bacterium]